MESDYIDPANIDYQEDLPIFFKALCYLIPLIGFIMYFVHKYNNEERKSKSALVAAIFGMIVNVVLVFFFV